jgi:hypothetical protein
MLSGPADLFNLRDVSSLRTKVSVIRIGPILCDISYKGGVGYTILKFGKRKQKKNIG